MGKIAYEATMDTITAIIPARAGSKRVPKKNIKKIAGMPLIAWTIEAALECSGLGRVIVSTDDEKIARVARHWGAEAPFLRPPDLATDTATSFAVVRHTMEWLEHAQGYAPNYCLLLQPTSPLRTAEDIKASIRLIGNRDASAVVSVTQAKNQLFAIRKMKEDGTLWNYFGIAEKSSWQDIPVAYVVNGAIYLNRWENLKKEREFVPDGAVGYVMPAERSVDIDEPMDFILAEQLLKRRNKMVSH